MPTPITRGAASALGFGFLSLSQTHWISFGTLAASTTGLLAQENPSKNLMVLNASSNGLIEILPTGLWTSAYTKSIGSIYGLGYYNNLGYNSAGTKMVIAATRTNAASTVYNAMAVFHDASSSSVLYISYWTASYVAFNANSKYVGNNVAFCGTYNNGSGTTGLYITTINSNTYAWVLQKLLTSTVDSLDGIDIAPNNINGWYALGSNVIVSYAANLTVNWQLKSTGDTNVGITSNTAGTSIYIATTGGTVYKLDSSGALQWQRKLTPPAGLKALYLKKIIIDDSENVYVAGTVEDSGTSPGNPYFKALIVKYNSSGTLLWKRYLYSNATYPQTRGFSVQLVTGASDFYFVCSDAGSTPGGPASTLLTARLPVDGSLMGTYSRTSPSGTYIYADATDCSDAAGSLTLTTSSYTDASGFGAGTTTPSASTTSNSTTSYKISF